MNKLLKSRTVFRPKSLGNYITFFVFFCVILITFLGISVSLGLQSLLESELRRAAMSAAMAGAANYYGAIDYDEWAEAGDYVPMRTPAIAKQVAEQTFDIMAKNSTILAGFYARRTDPAQVTCGGNIDAVTVRAEAYIGTPLLALIGINQIRVVTGETARAVKYNPLHALGRGPGNPIDIPPGSYRVINLAYPIVDKKGIDIIIHQVPNDTNPAYYREGYVVEGCIDDGPNGGANARCYDLGAGARPMHAGDTANFNSIIQHDVSNGINFWGSKDWWNTGTNGGEYIHYGESAFNLRLSGLNKITKLRIRNAATGTLWDVDGAHVFIDYIYTYGFASACSSPGNGGAALPNCPLPVGFYGASDNGAGCTLPYPDGEV